MQLSYCAQMVRTHDPDRFLAALFIPAPAREALLSLLALNVELANIHYATREEMIGHIRHAWWQEAVDALYEGQPPKEQPVLQALAPVIAAGQLPREKMNMLLENYREHFPTLPPDLDAILDEMNVILMRALSVDESGWRKASAVIAAHRQRHGRKWNGWLHVRLLVAGFNLSS